jgi:hypothetical protein
LEEIEAFFEVIRADGTGIGLEALAMGEQQEFQPARSLVVAHTTTNNL